MTQSLPISWGLAFASSSLGMYPYCIVAPRVQQGRGVELFLLAVEPREKHVRIELNSLVLCPSPLSFLMANSLPPAQKDTSSIKFYQHRMFAEVLCPEHAISVNKRFLVKAISKPGLSRDDALKMLY